MSSDICSKVCMLCVSVNVFFPLLELVRVEQAHSENIDATHHTLQASSTSCADI